MFGLLLMVAATPQISAEVEKRYSSAFNTCLANGDAARGVTSAMAECQGTELDRQDARLNQAYKMVMDRLPRNRKKVLRSLQRRWIGDRDAACMAASEAAGGGTASGLEYQGCLLSQTVRRTIFLERYR